jgi:hypothetical protein
MHKGGRDQSLHICMLEHSQSVTAQFGCLVSCIICCWRCWRSRDQKGFPPDILLDKHLASEFIRADPVNAAFRTVVAV